MGEWSDYFKDFPEENAANYDDKGQFNPDHLEEKERQDIANSKLDEALIKKSVNDSSDSKPPYDQ